MIAIGFFLNGVAQKHLDDDEDCEPKQVNECTGRPLSDGIGAC